MTPEESRKKMITRMLHMDADKDGESEGNGNHGNTHIPYGLCRKFGIELPDGATPKEAWEALEGEGISASDTYDTLKREGTIRGITGGNKGVNQTGKKRQGIKQYRHFSSQNGGRGLSKIKEAIKEDVGTEIEFGGGRVDNATAEKTYNVLRTMKEEYGITIPQINFRIEDQDTLATTYAPPKSYMEVNTTGKGLYEINQEGRKGIKKELDKCQRKIDANKRKLKELKQGQWEEVQDAERSVKFWEKEKKPYERQYRYKNGHNVLYKGKEYESVLAHEFGHVLQNNARAEIENRGGDKREYRDQLDEVYRRAQKTGDMYNISMYANTDAEEFFSEAFTQYVFGEQSLPDYCVDFIEKIIGMAGDKG